jgi:hypothetical protein
MASRWQKKPTKATDATLAGPWCLGLAWEEARLHPGQGRSLGWMPALAPRWIGPCSSKWFVPCRMKGL